MKAAIDRSVGFSDAAFGITGRFGACSRLG